MTKVFDFAFLDNGAYDVAEDGNSVDIYGAAHTPRPVALEVRFTLTLSREVGSYIVFDDDDAEEAGIGLGLEKAEAIVLDLLRSAPLGIVGNRYALDRSTVDAYLPARWIGGGSNEHIETASQYCAFCVPSDGDETGNLTDVLVFSDYSDECPEFSATECKTREDVADGLRLDGLPEETAQAIANAINF